MFDLTRIAEPDFGYNGHKEAPSSQEPAENILATQFKKDSGEIYCRHCATKPEPYTVNAEYKNTLF